jgi:ribosomal protein S27E
VKFKTGHESRCMGHRHIRCRNCRHILMVHDDDESIFGCLACMLNGNECLKFAAEGFNPEA